jgi:hypothetical protein
MDLFPALPLGKAGLASALQEAQDGGSKKGCEGELFGPVELPAASGETSSQVTDPVQSWLLDSPLKTTLVGFEGGLAASKELPVIEVEMGVGEEGGVDEASLVQGRPLPMTDLRSVVTAVAPMAQGKRTKTVASMAPTKAIKKKALATPSRKSTRNGGAAVTSAMEKAKKLAAERNLDPAMAGTDTDDFSILDARSDEQLGSVITDSCILFVPSAGTPMEAISLLRAKEEAQAALARVAASQAREREAREACDEVLGDPTAAGEAAAPGPVTDQDPAMGRGPTQTDGRGARSPSMGSDAEDREATQRTSSRPLRKKGRRSNLTMRKGRGKRTKDL